jgi:hypothetical protein
LLIGDDGRGTLLASCMLRIHIYLPPMRPNSVLKISSHPPPLCRSRGFENVIDDREAVAPIKHMGCPLYPDEPTPSA